MPSVLPYPADIIRSSADTARRLAASFHRRGDAQYAEHLERRERQAGGIGRTCEVSHSATYPATTTVSS